MLGATIKVAGFVVLVGGWASDLMAEAAGEFRPAPQLARYEQQGDDEEIAKLVVEIRLPGPEARQKREGAVAALLAMKSRKAHAALQQVLVAREDSDAVGEAVLRQLLDRLGNRRDRVLWIPDDAAAQELRGSWIGPLVTVAGASSVADTRVVMAQRALRQFESWDRVPAFQELLEPDSPSRLTAVRAAGTCRDLGLVRMLGDFLADPELRVAAQGALRGLTFRDFQDRQQLDAWLQELGHRTFVDLAADAATTGQRTLQTELRRTILALVDSYVEQPEIPWRKLSDQVLRSEPPGTTLACLEHLRELLERSPSLTGSAAERQQFLESLLQYLEAQKRHNEDDGYAVTLEVCAYLLAPGEEEEQLRAAIELRLRMALKSAHQGTRLAALAGLRRFPSPFNRREVVQVAHQALASIDDPEQVRLLEAALSTLHAPEWTAPARDALGLGDWVTLLGWVIQRPDVPERLRRDAVEVLKLRDGDKARVVDGFRILSDTVRDPKQDSRVRDVAFIELRSFVTTSQHSRDYVQLLVSGLGDSDSAIRNRAAVLMHELPGWKLPGAEKDGQVEQWVGELLDAAGERLLSEPEATRLETVADSMRRIAGQGDYSEKVIQLMSQALEQIAAAPADKPEPFRRKHIVEELRILASNAECKTELWLRAGQAVLGVGERLAARAILERHEELGTLTRDGHLLTIRTALSKTGGKTWIDPELMGEATSVLKAIAELGDELPIDEVTDATLLRMDIEGDRGQHERVIELGRTLPKNGGLTDAQRRRAAVRIAHSHLQLDQPSEAQAWLAKLTGDDAGAPDVLSLLHDVANSFAATEQYPKAQEVGKILVERTPETAPDAPARWLLYAMALFKADPDNNAGRVRELLEQKEALFRDVSGKVKSDYDTLQRLVQTG